jgi:hypothetical protein
MCHSLQGTSGNVTSVRCVPWLVTDPAERQESCQRHMCSVFHGVMRPCSSLDIGIHQHQITCRDCSGPDVLRTRVQVDERGAAVAGPGLRGPRCLVCSSAWTKMRRLCATFDHRACKLEGRQSWRCWASYDGWQQPALRPWRGPPGAGPAVADRNVQSC